MYALTRDGAGAHYLEVSCGGIAVETVVVSLTGEEMKRYSEEGITFLDDLAFNIAQHQSKFAHRIVPV